MISVLTGDIIDSRTSTEQKAWQQAIKKYFTTLGTTPKVWQIYAGDSFQRAVTDIRQAFKVSIMTKAIIKQAANLNVRIAIGIGDKTHNAKEVTASNGTAFIHSGELLEKLKNDSDTLAISSEWKDWDELMNLLFSLALISIDSWTASIAELWILMQKYPNKNQQFYAKKLKISQASVSDRKRRGHFDKIEQLNELFMNDLNNLS